MIKRSPEPAATQEVKEENGRAAQQIGPEPSHRRRLRPLIIALAALIVIAGAAIWYFGPWRSTVSTDDAFIDGLVVQVSPRVSGRVQNVRITDNQRVEAGDVIIELDPRDLQASADEAKAAVDLAQAQLNAAQSDLELTKATTAAAIEQAQAEVQAAKAAVDQSQAEYAAALSDLDRARADLARYEQIEGPAVSQQQIDLARATALRDEAQAEAARKVVTAAEAQVVAAQGRLIAAQAGPYQVASAESAVVRAQAAVTQGQATLREAELQLSYTTVKAPQAGRITNRSVTAGNFVQNGQTLLAIVTDDLWVTANFKETQLTDMRPGQSARIRIDAFPGQDFEGHVDSIQAGSGAFFSLLPPENASGNFVKVVQRVPVKIVFDHPPDLQRFTIGPGMSVVPKVKVK